MGEPITYRAVFYPPIFVWSFVESTFVQNCFTLPRFASGSLKSGQGGNNRLRGRGFV